METDRLIAELNMAWTLRELLDTKWKYHCIILEFSFSILNIEIWITLTRIPLVFQEQCKWESHRSCRWVPLLPWTAQNPRVWVGSGCWLYSLGCSLAWCLGGLCSGSAYSPEQTPCLPSYPGERGCEDQRNKRLYEFLKS